MRVLYANRDRDSVIFERDFEQLRAGAAGRLEVRHHLDADGGFLEAGDIRAFAGSELDADFYICGPGPFMDLVETTLLDLPVEPRADLHRALRRSRATTQARRKPVGLDTATDVPESVTLILKGKTTTVAYQPGDTVLETARRGGLQPPFSCEAGNCATCMALLREGGATMRANNALTEGEVEEGWILTCQSIPHGPTVTVEYEDF